MSNIETRRLPNAFWLCLALVVSLLIPRLNAQSRSPVITSFRDWSTANPGLHVIYQGNDGQINDYYWLNNSPGWRFARVAPNPGTNADELIGYSDGTYNHVFAVIPDYNPNDSGLYPSIAEWWGTGVPTNFNNLTLAADNWNGLPGYSARCYGNQMCLVNPTPLAGYAESLTQNEHVFYVDF